MPGEIDADAKKISALGNGVTGGTYSLLATDLIGIALTTVAFFVSRARDR